ncbi:prophage tail fiber N-terminal domain-containing protein [Salmonella enterica]|nr:prophage tail fiber N-terminal domain-containing protein [Salmonella enterica]
MPIISGTLKDGAGHPVADCNIILKALNTTNAVIMTTTASVGTNAGQYRIDALPGRYEVTLAVETWPPQKVGVINVYADSPDGSLNDFLTAVSGDYLTPDVMKRFEQLTRQAEASAGQAEASAGQAAQTAGDVERSLSGTQAAKDAAAESANSAARSATDAKGSEESAATREQNAAASAASAAQSVKDAGESARRAEDSATASENSRKASEQSAKAAGGSAGSAAQSAKAAATSEQNAGISAGNAKASEGAAAQSATVASEQAVLARNAAQTAAKDAVAGAVTEASEQLRAVFDTDVSRAEKAAISAEQSMTLAVDSAHDAQQALKDAQDTIKAPGPVPFGEPGSYVLAFIYNQDMDDTWKSTGQVRGDALHMVSGTGGPYGLELSLSTTTPLTGQWQAMSDSGFYESTGGQMFIFQRMR